MDAVFLPLAHAGHWAIYLIYGVPVAIVLASILKTLREERRG